MDLDFRDILGAPLLDDEQSVEQAVIPQYTSDSIDPVASYVVDLHFPLCHAICFNTPPILPPSRAYSAPLRFEFGFVYAVAVRFTFFIFKIDFELANSTAT